MNQAGETFSEGFSQVKPYDPENHVHPHKPYKEPGKSNALPAPADFDDNNYSHPSKNGIINTINHYSYKIKMFSRSIFCHVAYEEEESPEKTLYKKGENHRRQLQIYHKNGKKKILATNIKTIIDPGETNSQNPLITFPCFVVPVS